MTDSRLKRFRVLLRSNQDDANGDRSIFYQVDKIHPVTVGKLTVCKDQVRVGLFDQSQGIRTAMNAESIHPETPENRLQRFAWLGKLMCNKSKGVVPQGIPLPRP